MHLKNNYHVFAMTSILMWSLGFVNTRLALEYFQPFSIAFLRYFVASLALVVVAVAFKIKPPAKQDWIWIILGGLAGYTAYITLFTIASVTVTASTNSIIVATGPVLTAMLAWAVYKERLKKVQCFAFMLEFSGILVMTLASGSMDTNFGVLLMFTATLFLAAFNIITRKLVKKYSPIQVTIYSIFVGTLALAVFMPHSVADIRGGIPPIGYFYLFMLGVFSSALAFATWTWALKNAPKISYVTNYMFVTPFLTTLLGFLLANELPGQETLVGGALILSGLAIFNFHESMAQAFRKYVLRSK